jgi:hypothetical protein
MTMKWTKGEVIYQVPKGTVVIEPIYEENGHYYIKDENEYQDIGQMNPFNGYFYRQDGK